LDRLDQIAGISRETAAAVETMRATVTALQARLTAVESQLAESQSAHSRTVTELEHLRGELVRIGTLERTLGHLNEERERQIEEVAAGLRQALRELRQRLDLDAERVGREFAPVIERIRALEELPDRVAALARQRAELADEINALSARLDAVVADRVPIEEAARQREMRLQSQTDAQAKALAELRETMAPWPGRIDAQTETVRRSQAIAESMTGEITALQALQREVAEAERLFEQRVAGLLQQQQDEHDQAWRLFLTERAQDWRQVEATNAAFNSRLAEVNGRLAGLDDGVAAVTDALAAQGKVQAESLLALRREMVTALAHWRDGLGVVVAAIEAGLPYDEQPSVIEQRQQAVRREIRARRDARED
jgi:DNA repair exonuclease SbcCD ATPase subunit